MDTALLVVVSPAPFHTMLSVVSVAEALVAEAHHVFLSVVVASHSFRLRILTLLLSRWHDTGLLPSVLTPVSGHLPALFPLTDQDTRGLENIWLMDSGCSRHMTRSHRWISNLYLGISRVGSGSGRAEKNPVEKLMARARPWPGKNSKMLARARPQPDPTARGPTR